MKIPPPLLHLVLGSGFGGGLELFEKTHFSHPKEGSFKKSPVSFWSHWSKVGEISFSEVQNLKQTSVLGHKGGYHYFIHKDRNQSLCVQVGRLHGYEGLTTEQVVEPLKGPFLAGTQQFILTNAAGALNPDVSVGSLMMIRDHINFTGQNPLYGLNPTDEKGKPLGPRFVDMEEAYDSDLSLKLKLELKTQKLKVFEGVYLGLNGPSFETPAEIRLFQSWGLQAVGMSTVWEVISLRHMGAKVGAVSLITNLGCGLEKEALKNLKTKTHPTKNGKAEKKMTALNHLSFLNQFQETSQKVIEAFFHLACR